MKIIVGVDAIRYPLTGIGRYVYEIARGLPAFEQVESLLYLKGGSLSPHLPPRPDSAGNAELASMGLRKWVGSVPLLARAFHAAVGLRQKQVLRPKMAGNYVLHGPHFYLPAYDGPSVATFHDLSIYMWPECHPKSRVAHMRHELPLSLKRAQVLITDSEFTRQEIASFFAWPLAKIVVAPLAASSVFHPRDQSEIAFVLEQFGLSFGSFSLFVGTLDPRKNIDLLLDVYERIPDRLRLRMPLVVVGFKGWKSEATLDRLRRGELAGWARYLGFVDEMVLPLLYNGARVFLYPSRYEGFGLPVLEAMASGLPVICSDAASLPEVAGPMGARLVPVDDVDEFYNAVVQSLEDDDWCASARDNGIARANQFSWSRTVSCTLQGYQLAIAS